MEANEVFIPPPECPVFYPTDEEFENPLAYIEKIRPEAEKYGLAKIRPPKHWQPPFAMDMDKFCFIPRVQRLNELEALSRVKIQFFEEIAHFWEMQGQKIQIPFIENRSLDMCKTYKLVQQHGGFFEVNQQKLWPKICSLHGFRDKSSQILLKQQYERIIWPFEAFKTNATIPDKKNVKVVDKPVGESMEKHVRKPREPEGVIDYTLNLELRKLQFYGAGPKAVVPSGPKVELTLGRSKAEPVLTSQPVDNSLQADAEVDVDPELKCSVCQSGKEQDKIMVCVACDTRVHSFCGKIPVRTYHRDDWHCSKCVAENFDKEREVFGFEQASRQYTLQSFGEMADSFKRGYFGLPPHLVPCEKVEVEFWRLVSALDESVAVEYGADNPVSECGSGFPVHKNKHLFPGEEEYASSNWNLNNLPVLMNSVLRYVTADISGMKIPWCYVGMCFSAFAWHVEDHWTPSINFMHWGEPKTWYGVPGASASHFEEVMKMNAPDLFEQTPDLLQHMTTCMNPNILMKHGVPVYRTNQCAGDFMVTFCRAYHGGFNQGFNFAEAVNFAPPYWVPLGRQCIRYYSVLKRPCVFNHDEVMIKMACETDQLQVDMALVVAKDLAYLFRKESAIRRSLFKKGVRKSARVSMEVYDDDKRQCAWCNTTLFFSAITCACSPKRLLCTDHAVECSCPPSKLVLLYRYTLDELPVILERVEKRGRFVEDWENDVIKALKLDENLEDKECKDNGTVVKNEGNDELKEVDGSDRGCEQNCEDEKVMINSDSNSDNRVQFKEEVQDEDGKEKEEEKCTLDDLRALVSRADKSNLVKSGNSIYSTLTGHVQRAERCSKIINQLLQSRIRTRRTGDSVASKLSYAELKIFVNLVDSQKCIVPNAHKLGVLFSQAESVQREAKEILQNDFPDKDRIAGVVEIMEALDLDFPDYSRLKGMLNLACWLDEVAVAMPFGEESFNENGFLNEDSKNSSDEEKNSSDEEPDKVSVEDIKSLIEKGKDLSEFPVVENVLKRLQEFVEKAEYWNNKALEILHASPRPLLETVEMLMKEMKKLPVFMANLTDIDQAVKKTKKWLSDFMQLMEGKFPPYLHEVEALLNRATRLPMQLSHVMQLEEFVDAAKVWKEKVSKIFLRKNTPASLLEVLLPRRDIKELSSGEDIKSSQRRSRKSGNSAFPGLELHGGNTMDPSVIVQAVMRAQNEEVLGMSILRVHNKEAQKGKLFCLCRRSRTGGMLPCRLCCDWYHASCVPAVKTLLASNKHGSHRSVLVCPRCQRTKRPSFESLLGMLMGMQLLRVRTPEGEALQCLAERAIDWKERADLLLQEPQIFSFLSRARHGKSEVKGAMADILGTGGDTADDANWMRQALHICSQVEHLVVEGDMIELWLPEKDKLWSLFRLADSKCGSDMDRPLFTPPDARKHKIEVPRIKKPVHKVAGSGQIRRKSDTFHPKKRTALTTPESDSATKKSRGKRSDMQNVDLCSAEPCYNPSGNHVNWVQCDKCDLWYHYTCVGLYGDDLGSEEYSCYRCESHSKKIRSRNSSGLHTLALAAQAAERRLEVDKGLLACAENI